MFILSSVFGLFTLYNLCFVVGLVVLSRLAAHYFKLFFYEMGFPEKNLLERYGKNSYVAITGASDGIGKSYAFGFAKRGFNLVLIARNEEKLKKVEQEIREVNDKTKIRIIVAEFSESYKDDFFDKIMSQVQDLDVSVLVNNVGTAYVEYLLNLTEENIKKTILVNCVPQAVLTRRFAERFVKREKKSAIITMSSIAGIAPTPLFQLYGASKAFVDSLTQTVKMEYPQLDMLSVRPGYVSTKINEQNAHSILPVEPSDYVEAVFSKIGYTNETFGHWKHIMMGEGLKYVPQFLSNLTTNWMLKGGLTRHSGDKQP